MAYYEDWEWWWVTSLKVMNVAVFYLTVTINLTSQYFMPESLTEVTAYWVSPIDPAGWAFSIWGVIYTLLGMFTFYQMVPDEWIEYLGGYRDNDLIFWWINWVFVANMLMNAIWLPVFQSNSQWGFFLGWFLLFGIWVTNTYMMVISQRNENAWWVEVLMVRIPFSVYSGWVTGATVLNTVYLLKSWGMNDVQKGVDPDKNGGAAWWDWLSPMMFMDEQTWVVLTLWAVEVFFEIISWWERNPVWGSVFTWASSAILANNITKADALLLEGTDNTLMIANVGAIVTVHAASMALLFGYLIFEILQPWYVPISFWSGGVFGNVDWYYMITQVKVLLTYPEEYLQSLTERELVFDPESLA